MIACEDTRHTLKLLNHYEIKKKLIAYHSHNEKNSAQGIIQLLQAKQSVALVSDGGSPCISDPGWVVVEAAIKNQLPIEALPGPTALIPVLSLSGFRTDSFCFSGFLSCKSGRRRNELAKLAHFNGTIIIYESPHRILKLLDDILVIFPEKNICVGKEISKINEKIYRANANEIKALIENDKIAGEYVVLVANY